MKSKLNSRVPKLSLVAFSCVLASSALTAHADVLLDESFTLGLPDGSSLAGVAVDGTGLTGNFSASQSDVHPDTTGSVTYSATGLTFGSNFHATSGGAAVISATSAAGGGQPIQENLNATVSATASGTVYESYLTSFSGNGFGTNDNGYTTIGTNLGGLTTDTVSFNNYENALAVGYGTPNDSGVNTDPSNINLALNTTYLVVTSFTNLGVDLSADNPGVANIYLFSQAAYNNFIAAGGTASELGSYALAQESVTQTTGNFTLNGALLDSVNAGNYGSNTVTQTLDELTVGTTLADVTTGEVVPEPGTWALMLGGVTFLVGIQRARRKLS